MKVMLQICKLVIARYESGDSVLLRTSLEYGWIQLSLFPSDKVLTAVKNKRILKLYLQNFAIELIALVEFGRQQNMMNPEIS